MQNQAKYSLLEAKSKIEAYCAYQERCEQEVRNKLIGWYMDYEHINILISDLIVNRFLNEERFAEAYVSGKINIKRWGRVKIRQQLKSKNISTYSLNKAMNGIDPEVYWDNLLHLTSKKNDLIKENDPYKRKMKLLSFLHSKGYEMDMIHDAVKEILSED